NSLIVPRLHMTHLLETLAEDIPDSVWINDLNFASSLGEAGSTRALSISGHAMGSSMVVEQDLANQFRQKLQEDPRIGKTFTCGTPRTTSSPELRSGGSAIAAEQLARMTENRSTYSM